jgi:hypothetical protein
LNVGLRALAVGLSAAVTARAQSPPCDYDRCALRLGGRAAGAAPGVLQGRDTVRVASGYFTLWVEPLESAGELPRRHYRAYRRLSRLSTVLSFGTLAVGIPMFVHYYGEHRRRWSTEAEVAVPLGTIALYIASAVTAASAEDRLRRAIWFYNRTLPRTGSLTIPGCSYDSCALRLRRRTWSTSIVRGIAAAPLGPAPPATLFESAGGDARARYETFLAYRDSLKAVSAIDRVVLASIMGGFFGPAFDGKTAQQVGVGFLFVGYAVGHLTIHGRAQLGRGAQSNLEGAIWLYNRSLPTSP